MIDHGMIFDAPIVTPGFQVGERGRPACVTARLPRCAIARRGNSERPACAAPRCC